ncbi:MAG: CPBP family intramembrane metalloprotease [Planctomycetes bacterium]|nr:CPBP family intramembrane metalloprotease [Planctomycetota bacterium]
MNAVKEGPPVAGATQPSGRYNLLTSLALITPLFLVYQVGVLLTWPIYNGADLITAYLVLHLNLISYIAVNVAVAAACCVMAANSSGKERVDFRMVVPLMLESAFYAFFLGSAIIFVMMKLLHVPAPHMGGPPGHGPIASFVMSAGAGVHEELLFRLLLMNGLVALFKGMKFGPVESFLSALLFSSTLFSAVHHLGPLGDPFTVWVFVFRLLAGAAFGTIYWFRGFAVAVYTHALYDMYVLIVR